MYVSSSQLWDDHVVSIIWIIYMWDRWLVISHISPDTLHMITVHLCCQRVTILWKSLTVARLCLAPMWRKIQVHFGSRILREQQPALFAVLWASLALWLDISDKSTLSTTTSAKTNLHIYIYMDLFLLWYNCNVLFVQWICYSSIIVVFLRFPYYEN